MVSNPLRCVFPMLVVLAAGCAEEVVDDPIEQYEITAEANEIALPVILNNQQIALNGTQWNMTLENVDNVKIHESKDLGNGSFEAVVSFRSKELNRAIDAKIRVRYTATPQPLKNGGEMYTYSTDQIETLEMTKVGW